MSVVDEEQASEHSERTNHETPSKVESHKGFLQMLKNSWDSSQRSKESQ